MSATVINKNAAPHFHTRVKTQSDGRHIFAAQKRVPAIEGERWRNPPYDSYPFDFLCQEKSAARGKHLLAFRVRVMAETSARAREMLDAHFRKSSHRIYPLGRDEFSSLPLVTITKEGALNSNDHKEVTSCH